MSTAHLTPAEIDAEGLSDWRLVSGLLRARYETKNFVTGLRLVNLIGEAAEEANHHPDLDLRYGQLDIGLSSHDVNGITTRDIRLARRISELAVELGVPAAVKEAVEASTVPDELLNRVTWKIGNALVLIGSRAGDERNAMTATWVTQLSMDPVLIGVGVDNSAVTHRLITAGRSFTVNLWRSDDTKVFVKFSKPATDDGATLNGRPVTAAPSGAPVFDEALAWMDCQIRQALDLGTHTLFVGEITAAAINDDESRPATTQDTRMKYGGVKRH